MAVNASILAVPGLGFKVVRAGQKLLLEAECRKLRSLDSFRYIIISVGPLRHVQLSSHLYWLFTILGLL